LTIFDDLNYCVVILAPSGTSTDFTRCF